MTQEMTALMTIIDILIIGVFIYAFWVFQKHKKSVLVKELRADFFLIVTGLGVIGLYYLCDLVCMQIMPLLMPPGELGGEPNGLHFYFMWGGLPAGISLIAIGFARSILRASKVIAKLRQSEGQAQKMGLETMTALSKLNEREAELTGQNERFHNALENMSQGLCMFDSEQRLIMSNGLYASMYGLSNDLVIPGTTFRQILEQRIRNNVFVGCDSEKYIKERLAAVSEDKASTKIQLLSDGRVFAIAHRPLESGGWVATHEDISELAKAEAMNQRLARIVEDAINEIYVYDADSFKFLQVNASACENLGYTKEELSAFTPLDISPNLTRLSFKEFIKPLRSGEKAHVQMDSVHRRKDGSLYDVKVTLQQIQSQNQQVFAAIIEDVTDRKRAEAAIRQSEELFSKAFHANTMPFSISGPDGEIYDVNQGWLNAVGYIREEVIGNSALKLGIWANPNERLQFIEMLKRDGVVNNCETHYRTKTGELRDMVVSGEWVEVDGKPMMFNISYDVTEAKAKQRQLVEHRDQLQKLVNEATADLKAKAEELETSLAKEKELNELQRQFISMASHEFRTPLAIIDSTAQRLRKSADRISSEDALKRVDKIRNAVKRMTQLMESTLSAARLEDGKTVVDITPCNVECVVSRACAHFQELAKNHTITCEFTALPETIKADASALDQVLTNLLSNAIKYAPDEPDILVRAFAEDNDVIIQVRDNGIGIDADDLPNMFGRFFRAKTSVGIAGTGIGLNLAKTLVEMHGGTIDINSKPGEGSTFTVRLPVAGPSRTEQAA